MMPGGPLDPADPVGSALAGALGQMVGQFGQLGDQVLHGAREYKLVGWHEVNNLGRAGWELLPMVVTCEYAPGFVMMRNISPAELEAEKLTRQATPPGG